ncbi:MAG: biopolymer transporter ExbD [Fibrobacteres bacterium]|nr:biopolymer transporter ExbD [Fibrobacterota bacterium]
MSGSVSGPSSGGKKRGGITSRGGAADAAPIDLDMTPMMNMLIILISFLVTMVVFTQLAVIKFNLPPSQGGAGDEAKAPDTTEQKEKLPEVDITVVISENGFQVIGEGRKLDPIPKGTKGYDFPVLAKFMKKLKDEYPTSENVVLLIDSNIVYQDIITSMDVMREQKFPNILLSGGLYQ